MNEIQFTIEGNSEDLKRLQEIAKGVGAETDLGGIAFNVNPDFGSLGTVGTGLFALRILCKYDVFPKCIKALCEGLRINQRIVHGKREISTFGKDEIIALESTSDEAFRIEDASRKTK